MTSNSLPRDLEALTERLRLQRSGGFVNYRADLLLPRQGAPSRIVDLAGRASGDLTDLSRVSHADPSQLFHVSRLYSNDALRLRVQVLDILLRWYESHSFLTRNRAEAIIRERFPIPPVPSSVVDLVELIGDLPSVVQVQGAENSNYMIDRRTVLKITKERHHNDFYSVIKLARNMHVVYCFFDGYSDTTGALSVEVSGSEMFIVENTAGTSRLMVQPFETALPIADLPPSVKDSAEFARMWCAFIQRQDQMQKLHGVVLDLTDSRAGNSRQRGNVMNTANVVVEKRDKRGATWKIIDPDVFDVHGHGKFSVREYLRASNIRRLGLVDALRMWLRIAWINFTRRMFVIRWQQEFVEENRKKMCGDTKGE